MFDLDMIELDWKNNSFCLSEEEIIEIYRGEGATLKQYFEEVDKYYEKTKSSFSAEDRLLAAMFGNRELCDVIEKERKLHEKIPYPSKTRLSKESQRKVIEGCLGVVFDETRNWYNFFNGKIPMEKIYYVCLEALMNAVKYNTHNEKPTFKFYIEKCIERNIIKYVARWEHISYREAYRIIFDIPECEMDVFSIKKGKELSFDYDKEEVEPPSKIFYRMKDESYDVDYIKDISSNEFMYDYKEALNNLDDEAKNVMGLLFDASGNTVLTYNEISEYLGVNPDKISKIKKKAIKKLRENEKLKSYIIKKH
ncbi:MAG: sigma-70 family RNA polymerase sigma factor [Bacilli bacterium]|nr:sigma-70 family RNA polymerase sigma factor [Bacilli bacterium]